jgi:glycine C-acetyltransferase
MSQAFFKAWVDAKKQSGSYALPPRIDGKNDALIRVNDKDIINLSSNNYLGFANHPNMKAKAIEAIQTHGVGAGAVRTIAGYNDLLETLEATIASFKGEEASIVFQSGFACNAGVIQAIALEGDVIFSDELNHASIIDGVRLSRAKKFVYPHNDFESLEALLKEHRALYRHALIISDGVFSMDGDIVDLPSLVKVSKKYDCLSYIDDAHGSGVLGPYGKGTVAHFNLSGEVDFTIGTLSKALGVVGGYVACSQVMKDYLIVNARPLLFSTALPASVLAPLNEAFHLLKVSQDRVNTLWDNARFFQSLCHELGLTLLPSQTPITPILIKDEAKAVAISKACLNDGVYISAIQFPTVPLGTARLRVMISAAHTQEQLTMAAHIIAKHVFESK